jgi:hypothetical protein
MEVTKKKLLSLLDKNINEMAMQFDSPDRPNPEIQDKLQSGDTPLKKIPFPKTETPNTNFQELLASNRYKQVVEKVRQYTGLRGLVQDNVPKLFHLMMSAHNQILNIESRFRPELEELAVRLVKEEMGIDDDMVDFDAKIVGMGEIDTTDFNRDEPNETNPEEINIDDEESEIEIELFNDLKDLDLWKAKRRMMNAIIQGSSKRGHYMFTLVDEEIRRITGSDQLTNLYGIMMSINDTSYWQFGESSIQNSSENVAGKTQMSRPDEDGEGEDGEMENTKIIARGINFPVLLHELIKGVMEVSSVGGLPTDPEMLDRVSKSEDTLEKEIWDIRLGPAMWDIFRSQLPDEVIMGENKKIQLFLFKQIFDLEPKQFLVLTREILNKSDNGREMLQLMVNGIKQMLNDEDYEFAMNQFEENLDSITQKTDDDELKNMLGDLGIDLDKEEDDEDFLNQFR